MIRFWKRARSPAPSRPSLPDGQRIYAIGDMHGRADLVALLLEAIARDLAQDPAPDASIIGLGDYVDRGPQSARTLALLCAASPAPLIALRGNHEQMLLDFLDDATTLDAWRRFGGLETLHSYGVDVRAVMQGQDFERARDALRAAMPAAHRQLLTASPLTHQAGDYFFCHAGVRPGLALDAQTASDLLWIRDDFLRSPAFHGKVIVHGHTPSPAVDARDHRINLDTGAYASGVLSCLRLEGEARRVMTATSEGVRHANLSPAT